ncbi:hypothetical protein CHS0354_036362 [Potamilus streckersoni]|uniref:Ig-like domain-containing protein n=1 Tax=Potamilus streckersoni TaxID=2493646 RepID=A0AAE0SSD0_9BIVA|nr:hypothetical protein CHS0354_036362 [Potamilus streckersoni]
MSNIYTEGTTGAGMTTGMRTSKQNIITTPNISEATHNTISTMSSNQRVIPGVVSTTTPEVSAATYNIITTMPSNQTVIQGVVSTTTPETSTPTHNTISTMPSNQTAIPGVVSTTTPEVSAETHNTISTMPSNQSVVQRLVSTTVPLTVSVDNGETMFLQVGSDATIMCSASGSGVKNIVWIGPTGNTLTNNTKYTVTLYNINTGKSTLTIFALSTYDSGSYKCRATGGSGSTAQDSIILNVQGN